MNNNQPLIVITGPTASGKTATAIKLAKDYNGEIICADSRTIYKGMDIGTAKPSVEEQHQVQHWGIDLVYPDERFTVRDFQTYATKKIADIRARGKVPFMVGGTGLYIDSVIFNFDFEQKNIEWRKKLSTNVFVVAIVTDKEELRKRIVLRTEQLFDAGVVEEATILSKKYNQNLSAMTGNIYQVLHSYLNGASSLDQAKEEFTTLDWKLAKRQMTWLRPNPYIEWCSIGEVYTYCSKVLASV